MGQNSPSQATSMPRPTVRPLINGSVHVAWVTGDDGTSGGACDADAGRAALRATGEYVERMSHVSAAGVLPVLADPGDRPRIEPAAWLGAGSPPTSWVLGHGLRDGAEIAVPAQAVFLGWDPPQGEVRWCVQTSAGSAAGLGHRQAQETALREVIERHVLVSGWRTGDILFEDLDHLHTATLPPAFLDSLRERHVALRTLRVAGVRPDVVVAFLHRLDGTVLTCGAAARGDTAEAVRHAVFEATAARLALGSARPQGSAPSLDHAKGLAAVAASEAHLRFVAARTVGSGTARSTSADLMTLVDAAEELFGRQPVDVALPTIGEYVVHRVVCHGYEVVEPLTPPAGLPCPLA
ncbi:YcaO-like family protein [Streptosporangium soli]|nr:YcaO-like family protein [Streptosporangium sp. KLBMP 9127]